LTAPLIYYEGLAKSSVMKRAGVFLGEMDHDKEIDEEENDYGDEHDEDIDPYEELNFP
jgi:hypothetical protein